MLFVFQNATSILTAYLLCMSFEANSQILCTEGRLSFNNQSLHTTGDAPNPYEKAITIIGKTLASFDEDNLIPCFGFGDGWLNLP